MNRLQKKCIIGTVGIHLLLLAILIVGPAFYNQPKADDTQVLDMIPANLVDAAVNSGVQGAQPPPTPRPVTPQPPQPQQLFAPPKIVQPPAPTPAPEPVPVRSPSPSLLKAFEDYFKSKPEPEVTPEKKPTENTQPKIQVNLNKVSRNSVKNTEQENTAQNQQAINKELKSLKSSLSSATTVDMPGNASAAYASYASVVKSVYEQALRSNLPSQVANNNETTTVSITIANDGTVTASHITSPSGDSAWDDAVQRTLDQVSFVAAFPDGVTEKERHYTLSFNPEVAKSFE